MRFRIAPPEVWKETDVAFDLTRQVEAKVWELPNLQPTDVKVFPVISDQANDDIITTDESLVPADDGSMFAIDAPGPPSAPSSPSVTRSIMRANFREFVRVRFDGGAAHPMNELAGSRCSDKFLWHVRHTLTPAGARFDRLGGDATETDFNDVGPGHIEIGDIP
jgi:hypothetical protein